MDDKIKQQIIVRQSQLKNSLDYWKMIGVKPTLTEVARVAATLTIFCLEGWKTETQDLFERGDKELQKKFEEE